MKIIELLTNPELGLDPSLALSKSECSLVTTYCKLSPIRMLVFLASLQITASFALPNPQIHQSPDLSPPGVLIGDLSTTRVRTRVGRPIANIPLGLEFELSSIIKSSPVKGNGAGAFVFSADPCCEV